MKSDSGNCQDITSASCKKDDLSYLPSSSMPGFSLRAIVAADFLLFALVALIFVGFVGSQSPQSVSAEEGRASTSAPLPVDSLQGSSRMTHFSTIMRGIEDHRAADRDFDDSADWPDRD